MLLSVANIYKKYYACIIYCYLLNNIGNRFNRRVFRLSINNYNDFNQNFLILRITNIEVKLSNFHAISNFLFLYLTCSEFYFTWQNTRIHIQHIKNKISHIFWLDFPFIFFRRNISIEISCNRTRHYG